MLMTSIDNTSLYRSASEVNSAMLRVYNHMALSVVTSMIMGLLVSSSPALMSFLFTGWVKWIVIFAPLAAVFAVGMALNANPPREIALLMLHGFAALMGLSMSIIFVAYTAASIVSAFMAAAVLFGTMSLYGYFTKKSLQSMGQFMFVGLIAVVIASIINVFIGSSVMAMVVSAIAVVVFLGLTAWDTQRIREEVSVEGNGNVEIVGALTLYLNFINIFLSLLHLFGNREE
jgi:FtsH-binding integral membrane protein